MDENYIFLIRDLVNSTGIISFSQWVLIYAAHVHLQYLFCLLKTKNFQDSENTANF